MCDYIALLCFSKERFPRRHIQIEIDLGENFVNSHFTDKELNSHRIERISSRLSFVFVGLQPQITLMAKP